MIENSIGCPNDGNTVTPGRWLCKTCEQDYVRQLGSLGTSLPALADVAWKQARIGKTEHHPSTGFPPSPIDWDAQELMDEAVQWMRMMAGRLEPRWEHVQRWRRLWNLLASRRTTLLTLDTAPTDYENLIHIMDRIERGLTSKPENILWGHCLACGARVMAPRGAKWADCTECGVSMRLAEIRVAYLDEAARTELGAAAQSGMHITRTNQGAADWLTETTGHRFRAQQVANWRSRGKLPSCKRLKDGYWEWSVGELLTCAGGV